MTAADEVHALKQRHHAMWAAGDYAAIAKHIEGVAATAVEAARPVEGADLLDVATGTGNAAIVAAEQGAHVTGLDLTPELFASARERAAAAGVEVEWVEGDAEELAFADASFDRVLSTCGVQFAPRHEQVARELVFRDNYGPTIKAREALESDGKWEGLDAGVRALAARFYRDGAVEQTYWAITGDVTR